MPVSNNAGRHGVPRPRSSRRTVIAGAGIAAVVALSPLPAATAAGPSPAVSPAAAAVRALTSPGAAAVIPADFPAVAGYLPERVDGLLVAPHGSCSSPVPLPAEFETACKSHDLGYDLLRYADRTGHPLGPWARRELDRTLADRMRTVCTHRVQAAARLRCAGMAEVAAAAVGINSMRQSYGVPVVERLSFTAGGDRLPQMAGLLLAALVAALFTSRIEPLPYGRSPDRTGSPRTARRRALPQPTIAQTSAPATAIVIARPTAATRGEFR
ncbi:hypothetical protein [Nocardia sp. NPDC024068]|uniref:hypothetical protein n=1 Tax=Nocardia sp. NPDC024068 TaxID=3157197 RepID=UPI0033E7919F